MQRTKLSFDASPIMRKFLEISALVVTGALAYYYGSLLSRLGYMLIAFNDMDLQSLPFLPYPMVEIYIEKILGLLLAGTSIVLFSKYIKDKRTKVLAIYTGIVFLVYFSPIQFSYTEKIYVINSENPSEETAR